MFALLVLAAADFLVVLDGLIVSVALPSIQRDLGFSQAGLQWVVNAYLLAFGGFLLLGGRAADLVGRRRVFIAGLVVFAVGSLGCGLAPSAGVLVAARAGQGLGAALTVPAALALLTATFAEGPARDRALGIWSAVSSAGVPAGALLGGVLTGGPGWRWVFFLSAPPALVAAWLALPALTESREDAASRHFDLAGAVSVTAGLTLLIYAIVQTEHAGLASPQVLGPLAVAVALLVGFVLVERRSRAPLVRFAVFRVPGLGVANLAGAALPVGLGALLFVGTLYLQQVLGYSALQTGLAYLALSVPVLLGSPIAARLVDRFGHRLVALVGFVVQAAGVALLVTISAAGSFVPAVLVSFVLVGIAAPVAFVPVTSMAVGGVKEAGLAAGLFNTSQQVGNAVVIAVLATVAAARTSALLTQNLGRPEALTGGFRAAFVVASCFLVLGAVAAWTLPSQQSQGQASPQGEARTRDLDTT
jgi:EmrB/QacA subfamily drug resistance transporter